MRPESEKKHHTALLKVRYLYYQEVTVSKSINMKDQIEENEVPRTLNRPQNFPHVTAMHLLSNVHARAEA